LNHARSHRDRPGRDRQLLSTEPHLSAGVVRVRLAGRFRPDSDIEALVEFETGHVPGLAFIRLEQELSSLLGRRMLEMARKAVDVLISTTTRIFASHSHI